MAKIRLNKSEALRRQTNAGIRMLFAGEDPVAVITVASAAFGIARDLARRSQLGLDSTDQLLKDHIKPGMEKEFWKQAHRPANFLKHADKDPAAILDNVHEGAAEMTLLLCGYYYRDLGYEITKEMKALGLWCSMSYPEIVRPGSSLEQAAATLGVEGLHTLPRDKQLAFGKKLLHQLV